MHWHWVLHAHCGSVVHRPQSPVSLRSTAQWESAQTWGQSKNFPLVSGPIPSTEAQRSESGWKPASYLNCAAALVLGGAVVICIALAVLLTSDNPDIEFIHGPTFVAGWSNLWSLSPSLVGRVEVGVVILNPSLLSHTVHSVAPI